MKRFFLLFAVAITIVACGEKAQKPDYYVAAFIWPSCHDDATAREHLWPDGEGEWEVIKKGNPRFEGHYQPRLPYWGYELDNDPVVVEKWINTALAHGVNTFIYDWYWFDDKPFLESALNDGFLKAPSNEKMNFYIMWANHDVKRNYWNYHRYGDDDSILWNGDVDRASFEKIVDRIINQYFKRPNYLKIDGCPVFAIFSMRIFMRGLGGEEPAREALAYLREKVREAGFPDVHIQGISGGPSDPSAQRLDTIVGRMEALGMDSFAFYNMGGFNVDYKTHCDNAKAIREGLDAKLNVPVFPCVSIAWDDTPRFPKKGADDVTRYNGTPENFAAALRLAKQYADEHPEQFPLITINAWNEWVEGSYLLPDQVNGFGYLEAVKSVMME
ncbi:MAG: glycoside hydrolase family 99-like domain-containing protein [Alistipes sp.]|nr:glycoside hydrolase family 99-like domain-containing protein [Alistipes sp.]